MIARRVLRVILFGVPARPSRITNELTLVILANPAPKADS